MAQDKPAESKRNAHICSYCGKGFPIRHRLNMHLLDHTGERPCLCNVCGMGFKKNAHLQAHLKTHGDDRPFLCSVCNKAFFSKYSCTLHIRTHTREKPEICAYCGERFRFPMDLNIHGKSAHPHIPSGHHTCVECSKEFTSLSTYSRHMVVAHKTETQNSSLLPNESEDSVAAEVLERVPQTSTNGAENPYSGTFYGAEDTFDCAVDWGGFGDEDDEPTEMEGDGDANAQQNILNNHDIKTAAYTTNTKTLPGNTINPIQISRPQENSETKSEDKPTPCPFCTTTCTGLVKLKVHMLSHMKDWQHLCEECGKECKTAAELGTHTKQHTDKQQAWSCTTCGVGCVTQTDLDLHTCRHTEGDNDNNDDVTVKSECPSLPEEADHSDNDLNQPESDPESDSNPQPNTAKSDSDTEVEAQEDKRVKSPAKRKKRQIKLKVPKFTCECGKVYKSETGYREHHMRVHQQVYRYMCVVCNKKFMSKPAWKSHELGHMKIKQYACDKCDAEYKYKKDLVKHQEKHLGMTFECNNCSHSFATSTGLGIHQARCVENITYPCPLCDYVASYRTNLRRHKKIYHKESFEEDLKLEEGKAEKIKSLEEEALKTIKVEELGTAPMIKIQRISKDIKIECECGKAFKSESGLRDHYQRIHLESFRYTCAICDKKFMNKTAFDSHEAMHQQIKRFPCDLCDCKYTYKKDLVNHQQAKHLGQTYECTHCKRAFSSATSLRVHTKVCIEGQLHYCTLCPYIASYRTNLKRHIKMKH